MNQNGRYLLDTNIVIALFSEEITVQEKMRNAAVVALAPPIIGELCYGHKNLIKSREIFTELTDSCNKMPSFLVI